MLEFKNSIYFYNWTLSHTILLNSLISSNSLLIDLSGFSLYITKSSLLQIKAILHFFPNKTCMQAGFTSQVTN